MAKAYYQIADALPQKVNGSGEVTTPQGKLHQFDYEVRMNSELKFSKVGTLAVVEGAISPDLTDIINVLSSEGGNIENYLVGLKVPLASLSLALPDGLPDSEKPVVDGTERRTYNEWMKPSNFWTDETHFYFVNETINGTILKASELKILAATGVQVLTLDSEAWVNVQQ